ncbi:MAG: very short patch repair endonuclease [Thermaurantiacus sp.]
MAGIRGSDTRPELTLRRALHARGLRYRLHDRRLPGTPDLVLPRWRAVIFVHGCFWHGHGCRLFKWPATRSEWWREKIKANIARDIRNTAALGAAGWRVFTVWECELRSDPAATVARVHDIVTATCP